ncbi:hypothetical protein [Devosia sp. DBB001]|nr:hypothetical protein [Devosia sp. DBB001]
MIAVLVAVVVALGAYVYQQQNRPGVEIRLDDKGVSVQGNG